MDGMILKKGGRFGDANADYQESWVFLSTGKELTHTLSRTDRLNHLVGSSQSLNLLYFEARGAVGNHYTWKTAGDRLSLVSKGAECELYPSPGR